MYACIIFFSFSALFLSLYSLYPSRRLYLYQSLRLSLSLLFYSYFVSDFKLPKQLKKQGTMKSNRAHKTSNRVNGDKLEYHSSYLPKRSNVTDHSLPCSLVDWGNQFSLFSAYKKSIRQIYAYLFH